MTAFLSASVAVMLIQRVSRLAFGVNDYADRLANAEIEKEQLQESLLAAQKLEDWSRMSAVVSHEIKNPLQAIQNLQFLIRSAEGVPQQVIELAGMAEQEAKRVLAISEASRSFIRQTTQPETIDLREAVESSRFLLAPLIVQKGIVLEVQSQGDCTVEAYAGETRQVVLNLLRNACEAITQAGKRVVVQMTGHGSRVELVVTDEGVGIAPEVLPSIFQFGVTTKGERGNGMGLWTVKHILNKHCGEVRVESQPGKGTRIELLWPRIFEKAAGEKQTVLKMDAPLMGAVG